MKFNHRKKQIIFDDNFEYKMLKAIIKHSGGDWKKVIRRNSKKK